MGEPAAVYNDMGIELLLQGKHFHALIMFKVAAQLIQTEGRINSRFSVSCCTSTSTYSSNPTSLTAKQECDHEVEDSSSIFHTSSTSPCPISACTTIDGESCFIVRDPMEIVHTEKLQACARDSAIVIYNMALTYHLLNVPSHQIERTRTHALFLYHLSYSIAQQDTEDETSSRIISVTLNNMAQIELELGNFKEAQGYFDCLKKYLVSLEEPSSLKIKIERNQLFLNATLLSNPNGAPAA